MDAKWVLLQEILAGGRGYGLQLIDRVSGATAGRLRLLQGSVYPALRSLEAEGLLAVEREPLKGSGRPRRLYSLTAKGRQNAEHDRQTMAWLLRSEKRGKGP